MTPAEAWVMSIDSVLLDDLDAWERLDLPRTEADPWRALSTGERRALIAGVAIETLDVAASYMDEDYTERLADHVILQGHRLRGVS